MTIMLNSCIISKEHKATNNAVENSMIVIKITPGDPGDSFDRIIFKRSQRIYKIAKDAPPEYMILLKESMQNNLSVKIKRAKEESDMIISVEKTKNE